MTILIIYIAIFAGAFFTVKFITAHLEARHDFTSLKTVTFGDESAVRPNRWASVISVIVLFLIWGAFTGSKCPICCNYRINKGLQGAADVRRRARRRIRQPSSSR